MRKVVQILVNSVLPIVLLVVGILGAKKLISTQAEAPKALPKSEGTLVEVKPVQKAEHSVELQAQGMVMPSQRIAITPQVSGEIVEIHPALVAGGHIPAGEVVVKVESKDYRISVDEAEAALKQAQAQLDIEKARVKVAEREWEIFSQTGKADPKNKDLATREPWLRSAAASVEAARQRVKRAKLSKGRTVVKAPFNLLILNENVEVGQVVGPQTVIASAVGTDTFWVQVSLPVEQLDWIQIPGVNAGPGEGTVVQVAQATRGEISIAREGRVERLLIELDTAGRMARLIISIPDPLGIESQQKSLPLLINAFVNVTLPSQRKLQAVELSEAHLHEGGVVYVMKDDNTLDVREVEVGWRSGNTVLITRGLSSGEKIVTSRLGTVLPDMRLRLADAAGDTSDE